MRLFLALFTIVACAAGIFSGYLLKTLSNEKIEYIIEQDRAFFATKVQLLAYQILEDIHQIEALSASTVNMKNSIAFEAQTSNGKIWSNPSQAPEILAAVNSLLPVGSVDMNQILMLSLEGRIYAASLLGSGAESRLVLQPLAADFFKKWLAAAIGDIDLAIVSKQSQVLLQSGNRSADDTLRDPIVQAFIREPLQARSFQQEGVDSLRLGAYHVIPGSNLVLFAIGSHNKVKNWSDQLMLAGLKIIGVMVISLFFVIMIFDYIYNRQVTALSRDIAAMPFAHPNLNGVAKEFLPAHKALAATRQMIIRLLENKS